MAERKAFLLRIDPQLWAEIESWAQADLRSVNGQIEFLLREAVVRRRGRGAANRSGGARRSSPGPGQAGTEGGDDSGTGG